MAFDLTTLTSLIGALGLGSVVGQWFAGGKDRATARAAVLTALAEVKASRWYRDGHLVDDPRFTAAVRQLETAALIARIPRPAVRSYVQLAASALMMGQASMEGRSDPEYARISVEMSDLVRDAAEVLSRAAWSSPTTRWIWLRRRVRRTRRAVAGSGDARIRGGLDIDPQIVDLPGRPRWPGRSI